IIYGLLLLFIFKDFSSINTNILFYFQLFQDIGGIFIIIGAILATRNKNNAWIVIYCGVIFTFISLILFVIVQSSGNLFIYTSDPYTLNFIYVIIIFFTNGTTFGLIAATNLLVRRGGK
ncbi:MAG: hypothetical protein ACFFKA_19825, partial [Candidatus Thorarchaeota archaeon]